MKILPALFLALLATSVAWAQPPMEEEPMPPLHREGPDGQPPPIQQLMQHWKNKNPEEFERMQKLREEDPQAFRQALQRKLENARRERGMGPPDGGEFGRRIGPDGGDLEGNPRMRESEEQIRKLAQAWRDATTEDEKARAKEALQAELSKAFDLREAARAERLVHMEKKLNELRAVMEERRAQREAIIEKRLRELTSGEKLAW